MNRGFCDAILSEASRAMLHKVFPVQSCPRRWFSRGDIAQIKTLCSVVIDAADSNAQEKISFNVVLILLGQYSTGQNHMQCSPRGPRQNYIRKNPDIVFLILLRQHCTG